VAANSTTYVIRVVAKVNGVYENYSGSCNIMTPNSACRFEQVAQKSVIITNDFGITVCLNPF
jgi:hypothetical protein